LLRQRLRNQSESSLRMTALFPIEYVITF